MEPWFEVKTNDVIALVTKRKGCFPWGGRSDETYCCLVFWEDGVIRMTVNEFYRQNAHTFECCRFYTDTLAKTLEEYSAMPDEKFSAKAYSAWCSGAR